MRNFHYMFILLQVYLEPILYYENAYKNLSLISDKLVMKMLILIQFLQTLLNLNILNFFFKKKTILLILTVFDIPTIILCINIRSFLYIFL